MKNRRIASKLHRLYPQKVYIFATYGLLTLVLLISFFIYTYQYTVSYTLRDVRKDSENVNAAIANSITEQLNSMSSLSMSVVYSNAIKNNFMEYTALRRSSTDLQENLLSSQSRIKTISQIITAIIGSYQNAADIRLYSMDGDIVEAGYLTRSSRTYLPEKDWYDDVIALNGHRYISKPYYDMSMPGATNKLKDHEYISLIRVFLDMKGDPEGIVEVIQRYNDIFHWTAASELKNPSMHVYIYNENNEQIYPSSNVSYNSYMYCVEHSNISSGESTFIKGENNEQEFLTYSKIENYNWKVVTVQPKSIIYKPIYDYRKAMILFAVFSVFLVLLVCLALSNHLTKPLVKLKNASMKITIDRILSEDKVTLTSTDSHILELHELAESMRRMYQKLRDSSQEVMLAHTEETLAKLQATQSFVNPHFLYNSLTNISVMADEEMNDEIVNYCQALCSYFRYITSNKDMMVPIQEELFNTSQYLECMKFRFGQDFSYSVNIHDQDNNPFIPKLIVQPIVENAFKYAFTGKPPWEITIHVSTGDESWQISITDNGGKLDEKKCEEILRGFRSANLRTELKNLSIDGLGLKSVYLRLLLIYGDAAVFEINHNEHATTFILGGPTYNTLEEYKLEHTIL